MKLYHFTVAQFLEGILRDGLTLGHVPAVRDRECARIELVPFVQWLTTLDRAPTWDVRRLIKYSRQDFRFTVSIPDEDPRLHRWKKRAALYGFDRHAYKLFDTGCARHWWIYEGCIPPQWLSAPVDMRKAAA